MTATPTGVIRAITCYTIDCADCGPDCWADFTPHFTSEDRLRRSLVNDHNWTYDNHGRWLCDQCTCQADCERDGHQWSEWQTSCSDDAVMHRWCDHCDAADEVLAAMLQNDGDA